MKSSLCYTYCTLLIVLLVSSGLLFILVASEASKPLNHNHQNNQQQQQEEHSPFVHYDHEPREDLVRKRNEPSREPSQPIEAIVQSAQEQSSQIVSEFGEILKSNAPLDAGVGGSGGDVKKIKKKNGLGKGGRRSTSRKKDILIRKPATLATEETPDLKEVIFLDAISKNAGVTNNGLQDIPGTPSVITLVDHQSNELNIESKLEENIEATLKNISQQVINPNAIEEHEDQQAEVDPQLEADEDVVKDALTQSAPEQAALLEDKINDSGGGSEALKEDPPQVIHHDVQNITTDSHTGSDVNLTEENSMPVFSEWAQKQMAEAEKKHDENVNASAMKRSSKPAGSKMPPLKLRAKNYAAPDCGAKIIASNPEAQSTASVLTSHKDEYLLNPCTSKIWFVVELCEPIQAERVELANFELFSSSPKEFSVSVSNRFPTRDWSNVGQYTAKDERDVQSFNLHPHLFGKFVRVEIHSHYNSEHYCPVSLFRVYGTSEFEAFETDNSPSLGEEGDDDDEELVVLGSELGVIDSTSGAHQDYDDDSKERKAKNPNNILKSAGEAVMSIVKKAAEALGKTNENNGLGNETDPSSEGIDARVVPNGTNLDLSDDNNQSSKNIDVVLHHSSRCRLYCFSLAYQPRCVSCSPELRTRLEQTMNCKYNLLTSLLSNEPISASVDKSQHLLCANILGFSVDGRKEDKNCNLDRSVLSWLPPDFLAGFCNIRAYDNGLISKYENDLKKPFSEPDRKPSPEPITSTQPTKEVSQSENGEQPSLGVVPSIQPVIKEDPKATTTTHPPSSGEKLDPTSQEDVNIFNIHEEASNNPSTVDQNSEEITFVPNPSSVGDLYQNQDRDDSASILPNGGSLDDIDNLLLDQQLDGTGTGGIPTITSTTTTTPSPGSTAASSQKVQPESVFLRLSNRIKALERNMSLSGQYLEELSRRYRKQVEELQHSYAKTLHEIEEQNRRMRESESLLREENDRLREEFVTFRDSILSWKNITIAIGGFVFVQLVVVCALVRSCRGGGREPERDSIDKELAQVASGKPITGNMLRRKSIDGVIGAAQTVGTLKKKRPSEEALNITGTYENLLIVEDGGGDSVKVERKKSRHKHRKISAPAMVQQSGNGKSKRAASVEPPADGKVVKVDLVRTESAPEPRRASPDINVSDENNRIDELPLLEDNDEFIIPTASDLSYNEFVPDSTSEVIKTNGMVSSSSSIDSKSNSKSGKGRRLSSPAFFKSSLLRSSMSRKSSGKKSTPSQNVSSASSNTSSSGSSNVRISINVHSTSGAGSRVEEEQSPVPASNNPVATTTSTNSNGREWYKLKKSSSQDKFTKLKSKSDSPEAEIVRNGSVNGSTSDHVLLDTSARGDDQRDRLKSSVSFNGSTTSSEKKLGGGTGGSFRRLFRKVF